MVTMGTVNNRTNMRNVLNFVYMYKFYGSKEKKIVVNVGIKGGAKVQDREKQSYICVHYSLMPYWTKLELLALLDCIALPIVLALA